MNRTLCILALVLCGIGTIRVHGEISDDDAFDLELFDQTVTEAAKSDSVNRLEYLPGLSFVSEAAGYRTLSAPAYGTDIRFFGKGFFKASKADIGALYLGCTFNYFLFAAADNAHYRALYQVQQPDPTRLALSLSEFHFSGDIRKRVFFRLGNQLIKWGSTYFWSPVDFINRQKVQADVLSVVDVRSGKPGLRVHVPVKGANIFLFTDFSAALRSRSVATVSETIGQAWRIDATIRGVNIGTNGYVARNQPARVGFDATANLRGTDLYGECALTFTDRLRSIPDHSVCLGGSRVFGPERNWTGRAEFYYNDAGYGNTDLTTLQQGQFTPFYSGRSYAFAEISAVNLLRTMLAVNLFGYANLADRSFSSTLQGTLDLPGVLPFTLYCRVFGGRDNREFTMVTGGAALQAGARLRGDF